MFAQVPPTDPDPTPDTSAQPSAPPKPGGVQGMVKDPSFVVWSLVFAGVLLLAAVIFVFFDRWRKKPVGETARDLSMSLGSFKEMYENGEITEAEYERIKAKWAAKMKAKGVPDSLPPAPPPEPEPPPPPDHPPAE